MNRNAVGFAMEPVLFAYEDREVLLYALSVGASVEEPLLVNERYGLLVLPSWLSVLAFSRSRPLLEAAEAQEEGAMLGEQSVQIHAPLPPRGKLWIDGQIEGIHSLGDLGILRLSHRFRNEEGSLLGVSSTHFFYPGRGIPGTPPPPRAPRRLPPQRPPDWQKSLPTRPEQALLFRLNGDRNPLHIDPLPALAAITGGRPILHGLCTFGLLARAVGQAYGPTRLKALRGRFARPVWPGDTLRVEGWTEGDEVLLRACRAENPEEEVMTGTVAGLAHHS